jgi:hypothetical protein
MKATFFSFLFLWIVSISGFAQSELEKTYMQWGKELKEPTGSYIVKIISTSPQGFYALRMKNAGALNKEQVYIEKYDSKMNLKRSEKLDLSYKNKDRDFEDVVMIGGQLYLLSSFNNEVKKKNYLFLQEINKKTLRLARDFDMIGETESKDKYREGTFDLIHSQDTSKILIYNQLLYKKNEPERFAFRIFDKQFNELWSRNVVLPYGDNQFQVEEYQVDKAGNVYLLGVIYDDKSRFRRQGKPTYRYSILAYTKDGEDAEEYKIDIEDKFITDLTFKVADNGNLVCTGFYSEKGTYSVKGTYFFRLDAKTKQIYNKNLKQFDFEFLTEYMSPAKKEKAKRAEREGNERRAPELFNYSLDNLILRSDGGALLIAEQYYVYERYDYNRPFYGGGFYGYRYSRFYDPYYRNNSTRDIYYNYNDIIIVNIQPDGEIEWTARIPKQQETINDGGYYSSYSHAVVRDKIYFIFNDNARNFDGKSNRIYNYDGRNSVVAMATLSRDGSIETEPLFSNRDADVIARPVICRQIGKREMMIYGELGRNFRFGKLTF